MSTTYEFNIQPQLIIDKRPFFNPFKPFCHAKPRASTPHKRTALPVNPAVDPRARAESQFYISYEPDFDPPSPSPRLSLSSISSIFSRGSRRSSRATSPASSANEEPQIDGWEIVRCIQTEYGAVFDGWRWNRAEGEEGVGEEGVIQHPGTRPSLKRRCASWGFLARKFSFPSSLRRSSASAGVDVDAGDGSDAEGVSEDPLAFTKEGVVEVRMGDTELVTRRSPRTVDVRYKPKGLRESVGCSIEGVVTKRSGKDV
ncbi:hypothetical protein BKA65DRAFT_533103 [Rhexocercosporidium sp. MPI-PUGE-AT-0058]|nr:hypothetical protein BKA65DRAFT_533103 [Rhexocercosporidium sp. MPI-PUGE-AT-0058]